MDESSQKIEVSHGKGEGWLLFGLLLVMGAILKLWLIHQNEVIARDAPHDASWFLMAGKNLITGHWLGPYNVMTLIRQPGYPLFIWLCYQIGIPLRIGHELILILGSSFLAFALTRVGLPRTLAIFAFLIIVFHPVSFVVNNDTDSEVLYLPLLLIAASGLLFQFSKLTNKSRVLYFLITGLASAILWNTRHENIILVLYYAIFCALFYISLKKSYSSFRDFCRTFFLPLSIPLLAVILVTCLLRYVNYRHYGLFVTSEMFEPGFVKTNQALSRIKPGKPFRKYVPISKEAREIAYSVSPSMRELRPYLEGPVGQAWVNLGCDNTGVCDDFSGGWFLWALRDSAQLAGFFKSPRIASRFFTRIGNEIETACSADKIPCTALSISFLSFFKSKFSILIESFPQSFLKTLKYFWLTFDIGEIKDEASRPSQEVKASYNYAANRRASFIEGTIPKVGPNFEVRGWVFHRDDPIVKISLKNIDNQEVGSITPFMPRPDVVDHFRRQFGESVPADTGFVLRNQSRRPQFLIKNIYFTGKSGSEYSVALDAKGKTLPGLEYAVEFLGGIAQEHVWQNQILIFLSNHFVYLFYILVALSAAGCAVLPLILKRGSFQSELFYALILLFCIVFGRILLLTLLDITSFSLPKYALRYPYPIMGLSLVVFLVFIYWTFKLSLTAFRKK